MTFSHGDYSKVQEVRQKLETAGKALQESRWATRRSQGLPGPGHHQAAEGEFKESVKILEEGLSHWPDSEDLTPLSRHRLHEPGRFQNRPGSLFQVP